MTLTIDPWADAPLEGGSAASRGLGSEDITRIRDVIQGRRFTDPALFPSLHWIEFAALSALAMEGNETAINALGLVEQRADFGGPLDEPGEWI